MHRVEQVRFSYPISLLVISFSVINYVVRVRVRAGCVDAHFFLWCLMLRIWGHPAKRCVCAWHCSAKNGSGAKVCFFDHLQNDLFVSRTVVRKPCLLQNDVFRCKGFFRFSLPHVHRDSPLPSAVKHLPSRGEPPNLSQMRSISYAGGIFRGHLQVRRPDPGRRAFAGGMHFFHLKVFPRTAATSRAFVPFQVDGPTCHLKT